MKKIFMLQTIFSIDNVYEKYPALNEGEAKEVLIKMKKMVEASLDDYCFKIMAQCAKKVLPDYY